MKLIFNGNIQQLPIIENKYLNLYVSNDGDDLNDGTINKPVKTLNRALDIATYCHTNHEVTIKFLSDYTESTLTTIQNRLPYIIIDANGFNVTLFRLNVMSACKLIDINFRCNFNYVITTFYNSVLRLQGTIKFDIVDNTNITLCECIRAQNSDIILDEENGVYPTLIFNVENCTQKIRLFSLVRNSIFTHEYYSNVSWKCIINGDVQYMFYASHKSMILTLELLDLTLNGNVENYYNILFNSLIDIGVLNDKQGIIDSTSISV